MVKMSIQKKILSYLNEKTYFQNADYNILINPSKLELKKLHATEEYRGFLMKNGDILMWNGWENVHDKVLKKFLDVHDVVCRLTFPVDLSHVSYHKTNGNFLSKDEEPRVGSILKKNENVKRIAPDIKYLGTPAEYK